MSLVIVTLKVGFKSFFFTLQFNRDDMYNNFFREKLARKLLGTSPHFTNDTQSKLVDLDRGT
jgi:hypothetical protein